MFKKLLIASAVLAVTSSVAFAANYKGEYKDVAPAPCPTYHPAVAPYLGVSLGNKLTYGSSSRVFNGLVGTLSLGYGGIVAPNWYLAGELFIDGVAKIKDYSSTNSLSAQNTWDGGLSIIPGYMITDQVLGYLRLGVQSTRFNNLNTTKTGWHVGLGDQFNVAPNWDMRAEYVYTYYGSKSNTIGRIQSNGVNLGLIYRFM